MLTLVDTVPEALHHIYLPCAKQLLNRLVDETGMRSHIEDHIFLTSETISMGSGTDKNKNPQVAHDRLDARLIPIYTPSNNKWETGQAITVIDNRLVTKQQDKPFDKLPFNPYANTASHPIFWDEDSRVSLVENTIPASFTLDITWRMTEMVTAGELMSRIVSLYTNGEMIADLDLIYDYPIGKQTLKTMLALARLRGVQDTQFISYLQTKSNGQIAINQYREGTGSIELVVNRNHCNTIFQIEMSQEGPTLAGEFREINCTVTVVFARANQLILQYPLTIMNNVVPLEFVPRHIEDRFRANLPTGWKDRTTEDYYNMLYPDAKNFIPYQYPWWDQFSLPISSMPRRKKYTMFASVLLTLDDITNSAGVTTVNITTDIPNCSLSAEAIAAYSTYAAEALVFTSEYALAVFADDLQVDTKLLEFNGSVLTIKNRRVDRTYRLVLCKRKGSSYGSCTLSCSASVTVRPIGN